MDDFQSLKDSLFDLYYDNKQRFDFCLEHYDKEDICTQIRGSASGVLHHIIWGNNLLSEYKDWLSKNGESEKLNLKLSNERRYTNGKAKTN